MNAASEEKMFQMLDLIAAGVGELREEMHAEIGGLRNELRAEMNAGFARVDRRFGNLETRVEALEGEFREFRRDGALASAFGGLSAASPPTCYSTIGAS